MNLDEYSTQELLDLLKNQAAEIELLKTEIALLKMQLFGSSSEKRSALAKDNVLDEASPPTDAEIAVIEEADEEISVKAHVRKPAGKNGTRKPLPDHLPIIEKIYELPEEDRLCNCGCILQHIKDEITETLEIIPAQLYIIKHIRKKYGNCANKCDEVIKTAIMPKQPLPKSIAAPGLIAYIVTAKYADHLPLYRQEQIFQRLGIDIVRQTLSLWVLKSSELLRPLYELARENICANNIAFADETTLQVIKKKDRKAHSQSYMWVAGGGSIDKFCYYYKYSSSRSHEVLYDILPNFSGYLHCDGYSGYDCFCTKQKKQGFNIIQVGCWYHARRKFVDASKVSKNKGIAIWMLDKMILSQTS